MLGVRNGNANEQRAIMCGMEEHLMIPGAKVEVKENEESAIFA